MKYSIILFIILFPLCTMAQTGKDAYFGTLARSVVNDLHDSWTLGIDGNSGEVDIRMFNKFKNLFDTAAAVIEDRLIYYRFDADSNKGFYNTDTTAKDFGLYAHDAALQVESITIDDFSIDSPKIDSPKIVWEPTSNTGIITYKIKRTATVQKRRQFVIPDTTAFVEGMIKDRGIKFENPKDSAKMKMKMKENFINKLNDTRDSLYKFSSDDSFSIVIKCSGKDSSCKIDTIKSISNKSGVVNDHDSDGVLDGDDRDYSTPGDFTANGAPDDDFDGVRNDTDKCKNIYGDPANQGCPVSYFSKNEEVSVFFGLQQNSAKINLPGLNNLGYRDAEGKNAMDVLQSQKGALQNPSNASGIYAGGDFTWYFGKRKQTGISAGFTYSGFKAEYILTEPAVYTFKASDGVNDYRRQITINSLDEEIAYNVFNFPVLFNYRLKVGTGSRSVLSLKIGPSLMLFKNTSAYDATIDFGGLYQVDSITKNAIQYYDYYDPGSSWNVVVTSAGINTQNTNPGATDVFSKLYTASNGYDFAENKNYSGKENLSRTAVAFNFGVDFNQKISDQLFIKLGLHLTYAPLFESNEEYIPINKTSDTYNSIYNGSAKSSYSAYGLSLGFVYDF
jgi:hypothetical protein